MDDSDLIIGSWDSTFDLESLTFSSVELSSSEPSIVPS